jgi:hypothetical protein
LLLLQGVADCPDIDTLWRYVSENPAVKLEPPTFESDSDRQQHYIVALLSVASMFERSYRASAAQCKYNYGVGLQCSKKLGQQVAKVEQLEQQVVSTALLL